FNALRGPIFVIAIRRRPPNRRARFVGGCHHPRQPYTGENDGHRVVADGAPEIGGEVAAVLARHPQGLVHKLSRRQPSLERVDRLSEAGSRAVDVLFQPRRILAVFRVSRQVALIHCIFLLAMSASFLTESIVRSGARESADIFFLPELRRIAPMIVTTAPTTKAAVVRSIQLVSSSMTPPSRNKRPAYSTAPPVAIDVTPLPTSFTFDFISALASASSWLKSVDRS